MMEQVREGKEAIKANGSECEESNKKGIRGRVKEVIKSAIEGKKEEG